MATKKKSHSLDDMTYQELKQSVPDLEERYLRIVNLHFTEQRMFKGSQKNKSGWKQLCLSETPEGMELDLWYRLVAAHKKRRPRSHSEHANQVVTEMLTGSGITRHSSNKTATLFDEHTLTNEADDDTPDWPIGAWT